MADVVLTAYQPLSPGARPAADAPAPIHRHIPGSTLRGALAARWLVEHGFTSSRQAPREEFLDIFERQVRFGPLFAAGSAVVPLSVVRCKYRATEQCSAEWYDQAVAQPPASCQYCGGPLEPGKGDVEFFGSAALGTTVRSSHVALTPEGTAQHGMLFTRDALNPYDAAGHPRTFHGRIHGATGWLLDEHTLFLGGARGTRGEAHYRIVHAEDGPAPTPPDGDHLVLRLIAPGVFVDSAGLPSDSPNTGEIADVLGVSTEVERRWIRRDRVGGWHDATGLPKPEEHVVTAGSTYLLRLGGPPDPAGLRQLRNHGLGLRRTEGFGAVELGPWQMPTPPSEADQHSELRDGDSVSERARHVLELDVSPGWFVGELKHHLLQRDSGSSSKASLLDRPRLRQLTTHQRERLRALLEDTSRQELADVINLLDAHTRGIRS